jgi:aromatic-L-amino-acid decarboxylase
VDKAVIALGLGHESLRRIAGDERFALRVGDLERAIRADHEAGLLPIAVVATVGTTSSTSVDDVPAVAEVCARQGVWLHVDAAYAGVMAMVPGFEWMRAGFDRADSIVVNPHKWLFTPIDCSVLWTRRPDMLRGAFSLVPEYLRSGDDADPQVPNLMDYGVSLGRRFRALKLWLVIRRFGSDGLATRVRFHCSLARTLADRVRESADFELLAPVPLSVVCLRGRPRGVISEADLDRLNERVMQRINAGGRFFLSHTRLRDRFAIRVAFGNVRTAERHADDLWAALNAALAQEAGA